MIETKTRGIQKAVVGKGNIFWCLEDMVKKNLITAEKLEKIKNGEIFYNEVLGLTTAKELNEAVLAKAIRKCKDISGATRWVATCEDRIFGGKKVWTLSRAHEAFMLKRQGKAGAAYYERQALKSLAETKENEEIKDILKEAVNLFQ